jgi:6-phosphogluconolactonase (cycloisomerase 2 family)
VLTTIKGSPFDKGFPRSLAAALNGRFLVTTPNDNTNTVRSYTINATTGALTLVGGPVSAGTTPYSVAIDPSSRFAYVANINSSDVWAYKINQSTGALTKIMSYTTDLLGPNWLTIDPTGRFLLVTIICCGNPGAGVTVYSINPSSGALTLVRGSPFGLPSGMGTAEAVAADPTGRFIYVSGGSQAGLSGVVTFTINSSTGALSLMTPAPILGGTSPQVVTVDPTDRFLYMSDNNSLLYGYVLDNTTGIPTQMASSPFNASGATRGIMADPSGKFVYLVDEINCWGFGINSSNGTLTAVSGAPFPAGSDPFDVAIVGTVK